MRLPKAWVRPTQDYLGQPNHSPTKVSRKTPDLPPQSSAIRVSAFVYLCYNVHQVRRRRNLPNTALNRVPDVVLAARLKHV